MNLFSPLTVGPLTLASRIVLAPLTRQRSPGGVPNTMNVTYYEQRASAGLMLSEGTPISRQGTATPDTPGLYTAAQIEGWRAITAAVHRQGTPIMAQLWHGGRISHSSHQEGGAPPVGPSAIAPASGKARTPAGGAPFETPHALTIDEIARVVDDFAQAARNALAAGFDAVQIHGANGYLIDQFLKDGSNLRTDRYGGSIANRARLLVEVTEAVAGVCGADRVSVRLSPVNPYNGCFDSTPLATFEHVVRELSRLRIAFVDMVETGSDKTPFDFRVLRRMFDGRWMTGGGYDRARAEAALAAGEADLIAFGKSFLANPDLPRRFATNAPLNAFDVPTFYTPGARGYVDYPVLAT